MLIPRVNDLGTKVDADSMDTIAMRLGNSLVDECTERQRSLDLPSGPIKAFREPGGVNLPHEFTWTIDVYNK